MKKTGYLKIYTDGASGGNPGPSGLGVVIYDADGGEVFRSSEALGVMTNNMAEYKAVIFALTKALGFGPDKIELLSDSELIVSQLNGTYAVKNEKLAPLYREVKELLGRFKEVTVKHIRREENSTADGLAKAAVAASGEKSVSGLGFKPAQGVFTMAVKESFDAAHYLVDYPGKCVNLHGHTWDIEVTLCGRELNEIGILYDFRDLKKELREITGRFDHKYLNEIPPFDKKSPTAENLAYYLYGELEKILPPGIKLVKVTVWESSEASVSYGESDLPKKV